MDLSISPIPSNVVGSTPSTTSVGAANSVSSGAAAAGSAGAFAQALQTVDTGPAGIRAPSSAEDLTALLSMVEMKLDGTNNETRDNRIASKAAGQRGSIAALVQGFASAAASLGTDQAAVKTANDTETTDAGNVTDDQTALSADASTLAGALQGKTTTTAEATALAAVDADLAVLDDDHDPAAAANARTALAKDIKALADALSADTGAPASDDAVQTALTSVKGDLQTLKGDQAEVAAASSALQTVQGKLDGDRTTIATFGQSFAMAIIQQSRASRTGDGSHRHDVVTSQNLDLGFDALNKASGKMQSKAADQTVQANASLDAFKNDQQKDRDVASVAASVAAGLVQVQAVLAALQVQQGPPAAASSGGRVRLSL